MKPSNILLTYFAFFSIKASNNSYAISNNSVNKQKNTPPLAYCKQTCIFAKKKSSVYDTRTAEEIIKRHINHETEAKHLVEKIYKPPINDPMHAGSGSSRLYKIPCKVAELVKWDNLKPDNCNCSQFITPPTNVN